MHRSPTVSRPLGSLFSRKSRSLSSSVIFDQLTKVHQRNRAAAHPDSRDTDYLKSEVGRRLVDRILDIKHRFPTIVELGSGAGHLTPHLALDQVTSHLIMYDASSELLNRDTDLDRTYSNLKLERRHLKLPSSTNDELDLVTALGGENHTDIIVSNLSMHWVNDLPNHLAQINKCLKPNGVFLGSMFGGDTLYELRTCLQLAELEREGGISLRVSPMTKQADVANLLARAQFNLTTVDIDDIVVEYPSAYELIMDLHAMGESNALIQRRPFLKRDTLMAAASIYKCMYGQPERESIPATFQIIFFIGWKSAPSQPKPLPRGSGKIHLKEYL